MNRLILTLNITMHMMVKIHMLENYTLYLIHPSETIDSFRSIQLTQPNATTKSKLITINFVLVFSTIEI